MRVKDLCIAVKNAKTIFTKIKQKHPGIKARLVLSTGSCQAPINSSLESLLDIDEIDFFVETDALFKAWNLLDEIWDLNASTRDNRRSYSKEHLERINFQIENMRSNYWRLIPFIEVNGAIEICILWDELDYEINKVLRADETLVDIARTPSVGGIKISLGTIETLLTKEI